MKSCCPTVVPSWIAGDAVIDILASHTAPVLDPHTNTIEQGFPAVYEIAVPAWTFCGLDLLEFTKHPAAGTGVGVGPGVGVGVIKTITAECSALVR